MSKSILIVEDEVSLAHVMKQALSKDDIRVSVAHNGREALAVMEKEVPDVVLLDILMPHGDGHEVLKAMKEKNMGSTVVVVSNLSDQKTRNACRDYNVRDYFIKSDIDEGDLWGAIEKHLR